MDDLRFTPAVLVTGSDEKGNEFCWWYSSEMYVDAYNEREISAEEFSKIYPIVEKVYFSDTIMTGEQWRNIQCPLTMSCEQIEQWRLFHLDTNPADVAQDIEREIDKTDGNKIADKIEDMLSGNPERILKHITQEMLHPKPYSSFKRFYAEPLSAEELENMAGGDL